VGRRGGSILLLIALLAGAGAMLVAPHGPPAPTLRVRNVLLITHDLMRADHVWPEARYARTPTLRRLAESGLRFSHARACSDLTGTASISILSGRMSHDPRRDTVTEELHRHGYDTGAFLSSFMLYDVERAQAGFDIYDCPGPTPGQEWRVAGETVSRARQWLRQRRDRPWFCWVMYWGLHRLTSTLDVASIPGDPRPSGDPERLYDEVMTYEDGCDARLLDTLREIGHDRDTLVILSGIHGFDLAYLHPGAQRYPGLYEMNLRVPLVVWAGDAIPPRVVDENVSHVDIVPTILSAAGLPMMDTLGVDLVNGWHDPARAVFAESGGNESRAAVRGPWKLVEYRRNYESPQGTVPAPHHPGWFLLHRAGERELFDLASDPDERRNLLAEHDDVALALKQSMDERAIGRGRHRPATPASRALQESLRRHGYAP
jgi:arylsulfatase A-like enzyme